jgi:hypothetical protein
MSFGTGPFFTRYISIDYSGAQTPTTSLEGLRVFLADRKALPMDVPPPPSPRLYWTRGGIAEWLVERLTEEVPSIVGIDRGFSFPLRYFEVHQLLPDWPTFLDDFQRHRSTDEDNICVDFVRNGTCGNGDARSGNTRWRRLTEERAGTAKSVFHYDVPGQVAKSTHAGLPWLRYLRQRIGDRIQFGPLTVGSFRPSVHPSSRFIHLCGVRTLRVRIARLISMMPMQPPPGCDKPISMTVWSDSWIHLYRLPNVRLPRSRAGFSGSCEFSGRYNCNLSKVSNGHDYASGPTPDSNQIPHVHQISRHRSGAAGLRRTFQCPQKYHRQAVQSLRHFQQISHPHHGAFKAFDAQQGVFRLLHGTARCARR